MNKLSELSKKSRTTKAWVNNVIRPVLLINMFCRAAHEGDFALVSSAEMMIHLMFAAGRPNYSRYGTLYVEWMHSLPYDLHKAFMKGQLFFALWLGFSMVYGRTSLSNAPGCAMVMVYLESLAWQRMRIK